ncbi:hypothetical protein HD554DRAFT_2176087 [Boletus coccyginus]|nr:hypothetical protein HD554DRAFT_2176087 [Boletus coccyginus]
MASPSFFASNTEPHGIPSQGPATTPTPNKLAMSRALGATFLNHQVEQLEKSVTRGLASGNWRDPRQPQADLANSNCRSTIVTHGPKPRLGSAQKQAKKEYTDRERDQPEQRYREKEKPHKMSNTGADKDADLVIVDASVLVHALHQVIKWCRGGREEIVIVPLEALNTLDLLKKGTSSLAQRACSASRILEARVGTNSRIRVQRDDAFSVKNPKVVLAVLSPASAQAKVERIVPESSTELSYFLHQAPISTGMNLVQAGVSIGHWASRAGIPTPKFEPASVSSASPAQHRVAEDDEKGKRPPEQR